MGDRTTVTLTVLTSQVSEVVEILEYVLDCAYKFNGDITTSFTFDEVNYGTLKNLPALVDKGIAYESDWEAGSGYGPGTESTRFTEEGEVITKTVCDEDLSLAVITLMGVIDHPTELVELIKERHIELQILPWDNQEEYGKRYMARQLIST